MTERVCEIKDNILRHNHYNFRRQVTVDPAVYRQGELHRRTAIRLKTMLEHQDLVFLPRERFIPTRTTADIPDILTESEKEIIWKTHYIHEQGYVCNICPDYSWIIANGLDKLIEKIEISKQKRPDKAEYLESCKIACNAIISFAVHYREEAEKRGLFEIAENLKRIPLKGASNFFEALPVSSGCSHFSLWCEGNYHVTIGRFDQFMFPYLQGDLQKGLLTEDSTLELLEEFFTTFNKDSDLYRGHATGG